jgi:hypothetical protein
MMNIQGLTTTARHEGTDHVSGAAVPSQHQTYMHGRSLQESKKQQPKQKQKNGASSQAAH